MSLDDARLDANGRPLLPTPAPVAGLYRFRLLTPQPSFVVGEAEDLRRRFRQYQKPGPTQRTSQRVHERLRSVLAAGSRVGIETCVGATVEVGSSAEPLDFRRRPHRLLAEAQALDDSRAAGIGKLENAARVAVSTPVSGGSAGDTPGVATGLRRRVDLRALSDACRAYEIQTTYDASLHRFRRIIHPSFDALRADHRKALLEWLNDWGCRQFALAYHPLASTNLEAWANKWLATLPSEDLQLTDLSSLEIRDVAVAYEALSKELASRRKQRNGTLSLVHFGATGAAKSMFAIRPKIVAPWDDPIRKALGYDESATSFAAYLSDVATSLKALAAEAGTAVAGLPALVGRPESPPPKLIDEYNWMVITKGLRRRGL